MPGSLYENRDGRIYNATPVIDPQGNVVARYRKMFPFPPLEEGVTPGDEFCVFDVPDVGRFAVLNCYDIWFPETMRTVTAMGAEVILHPVMTHTIDRDVDLNVAKASAAIFQAYVFDINGARRRRQRPVLHPRPGGPGAAPGRRHRGDDAGRDRPRPGPPPARARHAHHGPAAEELPRQHGALSGSTTRPGRTGTTWTRSGRWSKPQRDPGAERARAGRGAGRRMTAVTFRAVAEDLPGAALQQQFQRTWPAYRAWYLREGEAARPSFVQCRRMLREHLPELLPTWERLVELVGGGDLEARFLSLYDPPAVPRRLHPGLWTHRTPALVRNYDYAPHQFDGLDPAQRASTAPGRWR